MVVIQPSGPYRYSQGSFWHTIGFLPSYAVTVDGDERQKHERVAIISMAHAMNATDGDVHLLNVYLVC